MLILAIDTSCDETSASLLQDNRVLAQVISTQAAEQSRWGGVVPMLAQRRHHERIEHVVALALQKGFRKLNQKNSKLVDPELLNELKRAVELTRADMKNSLPEQLPQPETKTGRVSYQSKDRVGELELRHLAALKGLPVDLIAVTVGPGLALALEVGIKAAKQLAIAWDIPLAPVNHLEGHLWSGLLAQSDGKLYYAPSRKLKALNEFPPTDLFPAVGAVISGAHTELVLVKNFGDYELLGETLDDAAGEAFDKFGVMLGLGYPGGRVVEELAKRGINSGAFTLAQAKAEYPLPIAMQKDPGYNFSFSGLKTAALYLYQQKQAELGSLDLTETAKFCAVFQAAVVDSLLLKVGRVLKALKPKTMLTGGGVLANIELRRRLRKACVETGTIPVFAAPAFLTDNASMIGLVPALKARANKPLSIVEPQAISTSNDLLDRKPNFSLTE